MSLKSENEWGDPVINLNSSELHTIETIAHMTQWMHNESKLINNEFIIVNLGITSKIDQLDNEFLVLDMGNTIVIPRTFLQMYIH